MPMESVLLLLDPLIKITGSVRAERQILEKEDK